MLRSMTGFVHKEKAINGSRIIIELKSVNHRALEVGYHLPVGFNFLEEIFKREVESRIFRGHIICILNISALFLEKVVFNKALAKDYQRALLELEKHLGIKNPISIEQIINFPGILSTRIEEGGRHKIQRTVAELIKKAVSELVVKKQKEGEAIARDIKKHLDTIEIAVRNIKKEIPKVIKKKTEEIKETEELSAALKDCDINEEIQRIDFHVKNFKSIINAGSRNISRGKELDFIVQELQREANTTAAKAGSNIISYSAVKAKTAIEKIREQLQNVE